MKAENIQFALVYTHGKLMGQNILLKTMFLQAILI